MASPSCRRLGHHGPTHLWWLCVVLFSVSTTNAFSAFPSSSNAPSSSSSSSVPPPPTAASSSSPLTSSSSLVLPASKRRRIPVLSYHDNWVCVNKPAGLTVHRSDDRRRKYQPTLRSILKRQLARKVYSVHRLDHRTSGAILWAFDSQTAGTLHHALSHGTKDYIAILRGVWRYNTNETLLVDKPLRDDKKGKNDPDTVKKEARTRFTLLATTMSSSSSSVDDKQSTTTTTSSPSSSLLPFSIVLCQPETGRTHQIRRHAYSIGHPVLGDSQHGDSKVNRAWRLERGLDRLALHCLSIQVSIPTSIGSTDCMEQQQNEHVEHTEMTCVAPLSPELMRVFQDTDEWAEASWKDARLRLDFVDETGGTFGRHYRNRQHDMEGEKDQDENEQGTTAVQSAV